jgi:hypothetical protein
MAADDNNGQPPDGCSVAVARGVSSRYQQSDDFDEPWCEAGADVHSAGDPRGEPCEYDDYRRGRRLCGDSRGGLIGDLLVSGVLVGALR